MTFERIVISILLLPLLILLVPIQFVLGLFSMQRLGRAMIETGENLRKNYKW